MSDFTKTIPAASMAMSVPAPTAIPISARVIAGASFTPSPTNATTLFPFFVLLLELLLLPPLPRRDRFPFSRLQLFDAVDFISRQTLRKCNLCSRFDAQSSRRRLCCRQIPWRFQRFVVFNARNAFCASGLGLSANAMKPRKTPSNSTHTTVRPFSSQDLIISDDDPLPSRMKSELPTRNFFCCLPSVRNKHSNPRPGMEAKFDTDKSEKSSCRSSSTYKTMAFPSGCSELFSAAPAILINSFSSTVDERAQKNFNHAWFTER